MGELWNISVYNSKSFKGSDSESYKKETDKHFELAIKLICFLDSIIIINAQQNSNDD